MTEKTAKLAVSAAFLILIFLLAPCLRAQEAEATLLGKVTDSSSAVANAKVSVKNPATGQSAEVQTDAAGTYSLEKLAPGEYEITISAEGLAAKIEKVTLAAGASLTLNGELATLPSAPQPQPINANLKEFFAQGGNFSCTTAGTTAASLRKTASIITTALSLQWAERTKSRILCACSWHQAWTIVTAATGLLTLIRSRLSNNG